MHYARLPDPYAPYVLQRSPAAPVMTFQGVQGLGYDGLDATSRVLALVSTILGIVVFATCDI